MITTTLQLYLDVLMQHALDLIGEADAWCEPAQEHLRHIWIHIDVMIEIAPLPLPLVDLCKHLDALHAELNLLRSYEFSPMVRWHVQVLDSTLCYMSQVIAEYMTPYQELAVLSGSSRPLPPLSALL